MIISDARPGKIPGNGFSQRELRMIDAYECKRANRATITDKDRKAHR